MGEPKQSSCERPLGGAATEPLDEAEEQARIDGLPVVDPARYAIEDEIARGGHGRVLNAVDVRLGRPVALKEMLRTSSTAVARFVREALVTARLQHPGIVPVHEAGRWPTGELFYVMKRATGRPLSDLILAARTLDARLAMLPDVIAVADAVAYAHARRVIHRDIKPANVLVGDFGETLLVDWGIAKDLDDEVDSAALEDDASGAVETHIGSIIGTPAYMPPEQARGEAVDERADVYAIGATLYHLLTGAPPFASDRSGAARPVLVGSPASISETEPGVPASLVDIVEKAMARDRAARYPSAKELADDLKRFQAGQLVAAHRYSLVELAARWVRRRAGVVAATLVFAIALGVGGTLSVRRVVAERNVAQGAVGETRRANLALRANNDLLLLREARAELDRDPTASIAWLKTYPEGGPGWAEASAIAQDAWTRGVAAHVWRGEPPFVSVTVTEDGARVAAASGAKKVYVWTVATGEERVLDAEEVGGALAFSADGRRLATADVIDGVRVFDTATWTSTRMQGKKTGSGRLEFTSDGTILIGRSVARLTAQAWDVATGALRRFGEDEADMIAASPAGDGEMAVVRTGALTFHDVVSGKERARTRIEGVPEDMRVSADGRTVVLGMREHALVILDRSSGKRRVVPTGDTDARTLQLSTDGLTLATCGLDTSLWVWDLRSGRGRALSRGASSCSVMALSPDATSLVGADIANHIQVFETASGAARVLWGHAATIAGGTFAEGGRTVVSASADGVRLFRLGVGDERVLHGRTVASRVSSDGSLALTATADQALSLWNLTTGLSVAISGPRPNVWGLSGSVSGTGARVAFPGDAHSLVVWERGRGARAIERDKESRHVSDALSPDGTQLATTREDGTVWLYDVATGAARLLGRHAVTAMSVRFSPDGKRLASAGRDRLVKIWDLAGGATRELAGHSATVWGIAFSSDGERLVSGGADGLVLDWNIATGVGRPLRGHLATVYSVDLSEDGTRILSASSDTTVRLWDAASGASSVIRRDAAAISFVQFLPGDTRALSSGDAGTTWIWNVAETPGLVTDPAAIAAWMRSITTAEVDLARGVVASPVHTP